MPSSQTETVIGLNRVST